MELLFCTHAIDAASIIIVVAVVVAVVAIGNDDDNNNVYSAYTYISPSFFFFLPNE